MRTRCSPIRMQSLAENQCPSAVVSAAQETNRIGLTGGLDPSIANSK